MDCIFCNIIAGELPCEKVYEDDTVVAFLDITPVNPGHTLVVPKAHYPDLLHTPSDVLAKLMVVVKNVGNAACKGIGAQGFNVGLNNGAVAGQVVFHVHFHLMPRVVSDGHQLWHGRTYREGEAQQVAKKLRETLNSKL